MQFQEMPPAAARLPHSLCARPMDVWVPRSANSGPASSPALLSVPLSRACSSPDADSGMAETPEQSGQFLSPLVPFCPKKTQERKRQAPMPIATLAVTLCNSISPIHVSKLCIFLSAALQRPCICVRGDPAVKLLFKQCLSSLGQEIRQPAHTQLESSRTARPCISCRPDLQWRSSLKGKSCPSCWPWSP